MAPSMTKSSTTSSFAFMYDATCSPPDSSLVTRSPRKTTRVLGPTGTMPTSASETALSSCQRNLRTYQQQQQRTQGRHQSIKSVSDEEQNEDGQTTQKKKRIIKPFILRSSTQVTANPTPSTHATRHLLDERRAAPHEGSDQNCPPTLTTATIESKTVAIATKAKTVRRKPVSHDGSAEAAALLRPRFVPATVTSVDPGSTASSRRKTAGESGAVGAAKQSHAQCVEVEQRKIEMKRAHVLARRQMSPPPSFGSDSFATEDPGIDSGLKKSRRWFGGSKIGDDAVVERGRIESSVQPRESVSVTTQVPDSPSPTSTAVTIPLSASSSSSATIKPLTNRRAWPIDSNASNAQGLATPPRMRPQSASPPRKSSAPNLRAPSLAGSRLRKDRYGQLSRARSIDSPGRLQRKRDEPAYTSMQEMLESSGFADVRVITPIAALRVTPLDRTPSIAIPPPMGLPHPLSPSSVKSFKFSETGCYGTPSSLAPPLSMQHKASMLSLRGLFSLWKADGTPMSADSGAQEVGVQTEDAESETGSDDTVTVVRKQQFIAHTQQWVDNVTREVATLSTSPVATMLQRTRPAGVPTLEVPSATPRKIVTARATVQRRPSASRLRDTSHSQQSALRTLRAVVSDPNMRMAAARPLLNLGATSGYQSFALPDYTTFAAASTSVIGSPRALARKGDTLRIEYDDLEDGHSDIDESEQDQSTSSSSPPVSSQSFWRSLKTRASRALLDFGGTRTNPKGSRDQRRHAPEVSPPPPMPIPLFVMPTELQVTARPQLIRKAVSNVALRPVLSPVGSLEEFDWDNIVHRRS